MSRANPVKRDSPANQARSHHIYRPWGTFVVARRGDGIIHKLPLTFLNCIYQAVIKPANHSCCERRCISGHRFHRVERSGDRKYVCVRRLGVVRNLEILEDRWVNLFFFRHTWAIRLACQSRLSKRLFLLRAFLTLLFSLIFLISVDRATNAQTAGNVIESRQAGCGKMWTKLTWNERNTAHVLKRFLWTEVQSLTK